MPKKGKKKGKGKGKKKGKGKDKKAPLPPEETGEDVLDHMTKQFYTVQIVVCDPASYQIYSKPQDLLLLFSSLCAGSGRTALSLPSQV